jgi:hypothetical protein
MSVVNDLIAFLLEGRLPMDILKSPNRLIQISIFIDGLKNLLNQSLDKEVKNCKLNIDECYDLMKNFYNTSKYFDSEILKHMIELSKTFEDIIKVFTVGLHYRKNKDYGSIIADELFKKNMPHHVWLKLLTYKDQWYFRVSNSIEKVVLIKAFETAPEAEVIAIICNEYFKKSSFSTNTMILALSSTNIPIEEWKKVENLSARKEIKKIAEEKINQLRKMENHQLIGQT